MKLPKSDFYRQNAENAATYLCVTTLTELFNVGYNTIACLFLAEDNADGTTARKSPKLRPPHLCDSDAFQDISEDYFLSLISFYFSCRSTLCCAECHPEVFSYV